MFFEKKENEGREKGLQCEESNSNQLNESFDSQPTNNMLNIPNSLIIVWS